MNLSQIRTNDVSKNESIRSDIAWSIVQKLTTRGKASEKAEIDLKTHSINSIENSLQVENGEEIGSILMTIEDQDNNKELTKGQWKLAAFDIFI